MTFPREGQRQRDTGRFGSTDFEADFFCGFEAVLATDLVLGVAAEAGFDTAFGAVPFEDGLLELGDWVRGLVCAAVLPRALDWPEATATGFDVAKTCPTLMVYGDLMPFHTVSWRKSIPSLNWMA